MLLSITIKHELSVTSDRNSRTINAVNSLLYKWRTFLNVIRLNYFVKKHCTYIDINFYYHLFFEKKKNKLYERSIRDFFFGKTSNVTFPIFIDRN